MRLGDICGYGSSRVSAASIAQWDTYITTESMSSNRGSAHNALSVPRTGTVSIFKKGNVLVSNIRPYFKKIWQASCDGYCSNDVLVFEARTSTNPDYLYWVLSSDLFFDYVMATSKGTKMPRGDKAAIMDYEINDFQDSVQLQIAAALNPIREKIALNTKLNGYLAA